MVTTCRVFHMQSLSQLPWNYRNNWSRYCQYDAFYRSPVTVTAGNRQVCNADVTVQLSMWAMWSWTRLIAVISWSQPQLFCL